MGSKISVSESHVSRPIRLPRLPSSPHPSQLDIRRAIPYDPYMHQEPLEPLDGSYSSEQNPNADANNADLPHNGPSSDPARFPLPLLNWQVVEIEGEATLLEVTEIDAAQPDIEIRERLQVAPPVLARELDSYASHNPAAIRDQIDNVVVGEMAERRMVVMPGEQADFTVTIVNRGRWSALFEIGVEGWIDEAWTPDLPLRVHLEPHARQAVTVSILPPRQPDCRAGEHALVVVVRASRYPGHVTRLAATLVIERFAALKVGLPQPAELDLSWFVPSVATRIPITNQSNYAATIHLQGVDRARHCDFTFYTDGGYPGGGDERHDDGIIGTAHLTLQPGQTVHVPVEVRMRQRPFIGIAPRITPFRVVARMETEPPLRRAADGQLAVAALIGPWHMVIVAVLGVVAIFGTGLAGLALLIALRSTSPLHSAPPVATAVPAAPVVAFVIQMEQPVPTPVPELPGNVPPPQNGQQSAPETMRPIAPIVSADQVTAPGEPTPIGQQQLRPIVVTTPVPGQGAVPNVAPNAVPNSAPANPTNLTYGAMFKQVASQFDLDWRVLAAQAYLESGFDSLALSGQGDMGLMQIRPGTWNEWSPTVEASDPFDAYSNVLVGAAYLNYLRKELSARGFPQQEWMLVAYNWGPDKVFDHLDAGGTWESLDPARRQYADDILRIAASIPPS